MNQATQENSKFVSLSVTNDSVSCTQEYTHMLVRILTYSSPKEKPQDVLKVQCLAFDSDQCIHCSQPFAHRNIAAVDSEIS